MEYWMKGIEAEMKDDDTPVTAADRQCERVIREGIGAAFPQDAILGEEEGETEGLPGRPGAATAQGRRKWIIDPIDGTYNYARGVPIFATLLALEQDGEIVAGVVHAPAAGDTYWAEKGCGAYKNGQRLRASDYGDLSRSQLNFGALNRIRADGYWDGFTRLVGSTYRQRGYGDYLGFAQVFEGKAEIMLEVGVKAWDLAPMKILIEEAGGRYSDLSGGQSVYTGSCLVSNGLVHDRVLELLLGG
jgi:histidinol-phosphatase